MIMYKVDSKDMQIEGLKQRVVAEKDRRVYYQGLVYKICLSLDRMLGRSPRQNNVTVVGTADSPDDGVVEAMGLVEQRLIDAETKLNKFLDATDEGFGRSPRYQQMLEHTKRLEDALEMARSEITNSPIGFSCEVIDQIDDAINGKTS